MKVNRIALLVVVVGLLFVTLSLTNQQIVAQENLLTNPGFEEGHYKKNGISEITVPNGWDMHYLDGQDYEFTYQDFAVARPETVVWNSDGGSSIPEGEEILWRDGDHIVKIFKGYAPIYAAMSQDVSGLEPGYKYRLVMPIFTDIYDWDGGKVYPTDSTHGQVRLGASPVGTAWLDEGQIAYSGFLPAAYGQYQLYVHDFTATEPAMTVWMDVIASYPHGNNGFFVDGASLIALGEPGDLPDGGSPNTNVPVVAGPTVTPGPTATPRSDGAVIHVVQGGDTFWSLAIQYAATMGITPEEALSAIPELNNNPAFFNPGDELIIVPPGAAVAPEPTPEAETEESESSETSDGEPTPEAPAVEEEIVSKPIAETVTDAQTTNGVCVIVYEDKDGDAVYFIENENLLPNAAISLFQDGNSKASYVTDGVTEPFCFENLAAGTYQVQVFPPAGYQSTTPESWAVAISDGVIIPVTFGLKPAPQEVADASAMEVPVDDASEVSAEDTETAVSSEEESGGLGNFSGLLLIGAAFIVLLAGAGVFLLRRG